MVDFMLQKFGQISFLACLDCDGFSEKILVSQRNLAMTLDLHEDREEAQAGIPDDDLLAAAREDCGIDERPRLFAGELQENNAMEHADLWGGDGPAVASCGSPVRQRVF